MDKKIQMVDLAGQYQRIQTEVDAAIKEVLEGSAFINGPAVKAFEEHLSVYLGGVGVIPCANGTDALQIALMAAGLKRGDEVIVPAFTYVASAEVIALLGLTPVMVDVDYDTFNVTAKNIEQGISSKTKAVIPVHLFGQCCDMEPLLQLAGKHNLIVIEDNAQAIGAEYTFRDSRVAKSGTMGTIGCTSFFPSKNLGCYGDGGAVFTKDPSIAQLVRMIANHGQKVKYYHSVIGCNSRLDTLQAAILDIKLKHLDEYCSSRRAAADYYTKVLSDFDAEGEFFVLPKETAASTHVYHQYTIKVKQGRRDELKTFLASKGIPSMIYYPLPLHHQEAFKEIARMGESLEISKELAGSVLSLPVHTEMEGEIQDFIIENIIAFFKD